jgi:hypothetical protein
MRHQLLVLILVGCAHRETLPAVRFANAPPVHAVDDTRDVPVMPKPRLYVRYLYNFDGQILRPITRAPDGVARVRA